MIRVKLRCLFKNSLVMMLVLNLLIVPYSFQFNLTYASDSTSEQAECDQDNKNDGNGIYKPGCDFNKALLKVNEDMYGGGVAGIVEQFIGAAFALAATSAVTFTHTPRSLYDCPTNQNANYTIRIMQLGSLAYLIGELQAKSEYKKGSKLATDSKFAVQQKQDENVDDKDLAKQNTEDNNKQVAAYEALIKIMDHQVEALTKKRNLTMAAEVAYLSATGIEGGMILKHKAQCTKTDLGLKTSIEALVTAEKAAAQAASSSGVCSDVGAVLVKNVLYQKNCSLGMIAKANADAADSITKIAKDAGMISKLFSGLVNAFTGGLSQFFGANSPIPIELENAVDKVKLANNSKVAVTCMSGDTLNIGTTKATCAAQASKTILAPACITACESGLLALTKRVKVTESLRGMCCGADFIAPTPGLEFSPLPPGIMDIKTDIYIPPIKMFFTGDQSYEFQKAVVINTLNRMYFELTKGSKLPPSKRLAQIASLDQMINYIDNNFEDLIMNSPELESIRNSINGNENKNIKNIILSSVSNLRKSILNDASASTFGELLGFGVKLFAMQSFLGEYMRNTLLVKPMNRVYTFTAMSALNLGVYTFVNKAKKSAEKRRQVIIEEAQKFIDSSALRTKINSSDENGDLANFSLRFSKRRAALDEAGEIMSCVKPKKGGKFTPTICPNIARRDSFSIPKFKSNSGFGLTPQYSQATSLLGNAVYGAATGQTYTKPKEMSASLGKLDNLRKSLRSGNAKILKNLDKINSQIKTNGPKKKNRVRLSAATARFKKLFSGAPVTPQALSSGAAELAKDLEVDNKDSKQGSNLNSKTAGINIPTFDIPSSQSFDFDDSEVDEFSDGTDVTSDKSSQDLSNFQVNNGEVNENSDVNIFKLISNRYLRSYPVLLEER